MIDNLKKILNENQDPKAIEKITSKLENLLMSNEEVGYIAVQKKPAVTILPESIVVTNKRIIICRPKNLGLSMEFIDYDWNDVEGSFVKEGILGSDFTFSTKSDISITIDYLPKNQARKLYTFAKEQIDLIKNPVATPVFETTPTVAPIVGELPKQIQEEIEETPTEEVTDFADIMPAVQPNYTAFEEPKAVDTEFKKENSLSNLSQEELFDKLQNYKKLLDNGLILQGEYDNYKKEILGFM